MTHQPIDPSPGGMVWTVRLNEHDQRTMSTAELIRAFESRQVTPYTLVSREGQPWTQVGNVPHLVHAISTVVKRRNSVPPTGRSSVPPMVPPLAAPAPVAPRSEPIPLLTPLPQLAPSDLAPSDFGGAPAAVRAPNSAFAGAVRGEDSQHTGRGTLEAATSLVHAGETDIATTPSMNRSASAITPIALASPIDPPLPTSNKWTPARIALLGAAAAVVLFGGAAVFRSVSSQAAPQVTEASSLPLAPQSASSPAAQAPTQALDDSSGAPEATTVAAADIYTIDSLAPAANKARAEEDVAGSNSGVASASGARAIDRAAAAAAMGVGTTESGNEPSAAAAEGNSSKALVPATTQEAPHEAGEFDNAAARNALAEASRRANGCLGIGLIHTSGKVVVVFDPSGSANQVNILTPEYAQPPLGACITGAFKRASVPSFLGAPKAVSMTFISK